VLIAQEIVWIQGHISNGGQGGGAGSIMVIQTRAYNFCSFCKGDLVMLVAKMKSKKWNRRRFAKIFRREIRDWLRALERSLSRYG